jgi:hypothetical protein
MLPDVVANATSVMSIGLVTSTDASPDGFLSCQDFVVGRTLHVLQKRLLLTGCSAPTRSWWQERGFRQPANFDIKDEDNRVVYQNQYTMKLRQHKAQEKLDRQKAFWKQANLGSQVSSFFLPSPRFLEAR